MIQANDIACLILASGASSRFGGSKMLYKLDGEISILAKTISVYSQVFDTINVIVREDDHSLIDLVTKVGANCISNSNAAQGLSQSIITGVNSTTPSRAWLFALGDMPYVSSNTIEAIARKVSIGNIVMPKTQSGVGNPVAFGTDFRGELLELNGDIGAKPVIKRNADSVRFYRCDDEGIHQDIDHLGDIIKPT